MAFEGWSGEIPTRWTVFWQLSKISRLFLPLFSRFFQEQRDVGEKTNCLPFQIHIAGHAKKNEEERFFVLGEEDDEEEVEMSWETDEIDRHFENERRQLHPSLSKLQK